MCRAWAVDLSSIKDKLDAQGVNLIAIGLEELGVKTFVEGKYFNGDLYIDQEYATYKGLGFKRVGVLGLPGVLISKQTRSWLAHANQLGVKGDMKGDGLQQGGTYVIEKGGKVLFEHRQNGFGDHPKLDELLSALNIPTEESGSSNTGPKVVCDEDACRLEK